MRDAVGAVAGQGAAPSPPQQVPHDDPMIVEAGHQAVGSDGELVDLADRRRRDPWQRDAAPDVPAEEAAVSARCDEQPAVGAERKSSRAGAARRMVGLGVNSPRAAVEIRDLPDPHRPARVGPGDERAVGTVGGQPEARRPGGETCPSAWSASGRQSMIPPAAVRPAGSYAAATAPSGAIARLDTGRW